MSEMNSLDIRIEEEVHYLDSTEYFRRFQVIFGLSLS